MDSRNNAANWLFDKWDETYSAARDWNLTAWNLTPFSTSNFLNTEGQPNLQWLQPLTDDLFFARTDFSENHNRIKHAIERLNESMLALRALNSVEHDELKVTVKTIDSLYRKARGHIEVLLSNFNKASL